MGFNLVVVLTTCPEKKASKLAKSLVESGLAACVSVCPVRSFYIWKDRLCRDREALLFIKTSKQRARKLQETLIAIHPYEIPEVVTLPAIDASADYLAWVLQMVAAPRSDAIGTKRRSMR